MDDQYLIKQINEGKIWATNQLYLKHRNTVRNYLITKGCNMNIWLECYNDAFVIFHSRADQEYFVNFQGSIISWFKKVSYTHFLKTLNNRDNSSEEIFDIPTPAIDIKLIEKEIVDEQQKRLEKALSKLGSSCRSLIDICAFSRTKYTATEIAEMLGYANATVVSSRKKQCFDKLKENFKSK